jgi:hypothetical protein
MPVPLKDPAVERIAFYKLPFWVRLAAALTLLNTWILIAEFVIDRYGLDKYLPLYRYGDICVWDIAVILAIVIMFVRASRIPRDISHPAVPTQSAPD